MSGSGPEDLIPLAEFVFETEAAQLGDISRRLARLKAEAAEVSRRPIEAGFDATGLARAGLWERWRDRTLARIEGERAALEAQRAERLEAAQRAFGRLAALRELREARR